MTNRFAGVQWPNGHPKPLLRQPSDQVEFIPNVYAVSQHELLGLVHCERRSNGLMIDRKDPERILDRLYAVGIAWSSDTGITWTYCGDVVLPCWDRIDDRVILHNGSEHTVMSNIGGIPYIITGAASAHSMLTLIFNETPKKHPFTYPAAARAPLDSVIFYARKGMVRIEHWKKRTSSAWSADPVHGCAARLLSKEPSNVVYDTHSDAAFCTATGRFLMTVNAVDHSWYPDSLLFSLLLFSSPDGETWTQVATLERSAAFQPVYSSFISEDRNASLDDRAVGKEFYILYARRPMRDSRLDYSHPDLYAIKVNVAAASSTE
jgi:hypothetical protein